MTTMVKVKDRETGTLSRMPASELAPGMILCRSADADGNLGEEVYIDAGQLKADLMTVRNPEFDEATLGVLRLLYETVGYFHCPSFEEWEHGFRCDAEVAREMRVWVVIMGAFKHFTRHLPPGPAAEHEKKRDVFDVLLACTLADSPAAAMATASPRTISRKRHSEIVREFTTGRTQREWARMAMA